MMAVTVSKSLNYNDIIALLLSDITDEKCKLKQENDCPSSDSLRKHVSGSLRKSYGTDDMSYSMEKHRQN